MFHSWQTADYRLHALCCTYSASRSSAGLQRAPLWKSLIALFGMLHLVYGNPLERSDSGDILCDRISWKRWKSGRQTSNIARQSRTFLDWIRTAIRDKWTGNDIVWIRRGRQEDDWHTHTHTGRDIFIAAGDTYTTAAKPTYRTFSCEATTTSLCRRSRDRLSVRPTYVTDN